MHSTDTATIRVLSNLLEAVDRVDACCPSPRLDLTAAFDTVDHEILVERLPVTLAWIVLLSWYGLPRPSQTSCLLRGQQFP